LVIGDDSGLAAKLRLLRKAAPIVDVMVSHHAEWPDQFADDSGARFHRLGKDDLPPPDHIATLSSIAIVFPVFSDGRGFTHARRLRTAFGFTGALIADGHTIPDQADYLFRCGFTHAMVTPDRLGDWQQARRFIQIHFQTMPDSRHSRFDQ
jgi:uncharacterized protein (DUF934 family)